VKADKVYLIGFMAAGKTTVARALAKRLDWRAVDIDELVEQREHQTVADIFAKHGEPYFRAAERAVLLEQIGRRHLVVATGGGTFVDPQNRAAMNGDPTRFKFPRAWLEPDLHTVFPASVAPRRFQRCWNWNRRARSRQTLWRS